MKKIKLVTLIIYFLAMVVVTSKSVYAGASIQGNCPSDEYVDTAVGCISFSSIEYIAGQALAVGLGVGGGIAILLIIYAGFMITTSTGNPERLKAGQELLTSAIAGIILIVFSVFLLRVIGVDILGLPGFGG